MGKLIIGCVASVAVFVAVYIAFWISVLIIKGPAVRSHPVPQRIGETGRAFR